MIGSRWVNGTTSQSGECSKSVGTLLSLFVSIHVLCCMCVAKGDIFLLLKRSSMRSRFIFFSCEQLHISETKWRHKEESNQSKKATHFFVISHEFVAVPRFLYNLIASDVWWFSENESPTLHIQRNSMTLFFAQRLVTLMTVHLFCTKVKTQEEKQ